MNSLTDAELVRLLTAIGHLEERVESLSNAILTHHGPIVHSVFPVQPMETRSIVDSIMEKPRFSLKDNIAVPEDTGTTFLYSLTTHKQDMPVFVTVEVAEK